MEQIPFNRPYVTGAEIKYIAEALEQGRLSGDGPFTKRCHAKLENLLGSGRAFLTTSCTDALEASALLIDIKAGDEVIVPSYTFVSTANAFALRGAKIVFADSEIAHPNIDALSLEELVTPKTRAIVPVHYAGCACDMDPIMALADDHGLHVVEDAAQGIASNYKGVPLGTIGHLGAFSFHETKNIISGEGGSLHVNDKAMVKQAEVVREKGTDRSAFFRGEVDKYGWVSLGSSYLPSELIAASLLAQLDSIDEIQKKRLIIWQSYDQRLRPLEKNGAFSCPVIPDYSTNNAHMYYLVCKSPEIRNSLQKFLKSNGIHATFHYQALHDSVYFHDRHDGRPLPNADRFTTCLLRLPLFLDLSDDQINYICDTIAQFSN